MACSLLHVDDLTQLQEESHPPPDPRLAIAGYTKGAYNKNPDSKVFLRHAPLVLKPYPWDPKVSVGPGPPVHVVVTGFDPFTPEMQLRTFFGSFGDIAELINCTDPNTGSFLGVASVRYRDSRQLRGPFISAINSARRAEKEGSGQRIGVCQIKVERDQQRRKCKRLVQRAAERNREKQRLIEAEQKLMEARALAAKRSSQIPPSRPNQTPAAPRSSENLIAPRTDTPAAPSAPPLNAPKGPSAALAGRLPPTGPRVMEIPKPVHAPIVEEEPILPRIKRKPYIHIAAEHVPVMPTTPVHLKKRLRMYDWKEIRVDHTGYYIVFDDSKRGEDETLRCYNETNKLPLFTYPMIMECQQYGNPDYVRSPSPEVKKVQEQKRKEEDREKEEERMDIEAEKKQRAADIDPARGAADMLRAELKNKIMSDIRLRIAGPALYDYLDPVRQAETRKRLGVADPVGLKQSGSLYNKENESPFGANSIQASVLNAFRRPLSAPDPKIRRIRQSHGLAPNNAFADERRQRRPPARPTHMVRDLHRRLVVDSDDEDSDDERRTSVGRDTEEQESRPVSRMSRSSTLAFEEEVATPKPAKRRKTDSEESPWVQVDDEHFTQLHKDLLGDIIQKEPEDMALRELEQAISTLPRTSKFSKRARTELYLRQRMKTNDELFKIKTEEAEPIMPGIEIVSDEKPEVIGLVEMKSKAKPKSKKKLSKKQTFDEREAQKAHAKSVQALLLGHGDTLTPEPQPIVDDVAVEELEEEHRAEVEWGVSSDVPRRTVEDDPDLVLDIDGWQHVIKDDEDLCFVRGLVQSLSLSSPVIENVHHWAYMQKQIKMLNSTLVPGIGRQAAKIEGYYVPNPSGSARTEGVHKITEAEKSKYLPHRIRVQKAREERQARAKQDPVAAVEAQKLAAAAKIASTANSRINRVNNRRLQNEINVQKQNASGLGAGDGDAIRFNQLKKRKKLVKFDRSAIHNWGLYAEEDIRENDMIIEYVGEVVRQKVADLREQTYDKQGIGSSYLFKMADDLVVDATKKGGIARFINHSCDPNCTAKIIKVDGGKRIVIYASRDIGKSRSSQSPLRFRSIGGQWFTDGHLQMRSSLTITSSRGRRTRKTAYPASAAQSTARVLELDAHLRSTQIHDGKHASVRLTPFVSRTPARPEVRCIPSSADRRPDTLPSPPLSSPSDARADLASKRL